MGGVQLTIRDGRIGRDAARATGEGGEILGTRHVAHPLIVGELLTLDDGTTVQVIDHDFVILPGDFRQTVHVGTAFFTDDD